MSDSIPFHEKLHTLTTEEFREECLAIIAAVHEQDGMAIIFDGDKPLVQITRYEEARDPLYGSLKGKMEILGGNEDTMSPEWYAMNADQDEEWYGP